MKNPRNPLYTRTSGTSWRRARDFYRLASLVATRQTLHRSVWFRLRLNFPRCSNPLFAKTNRAALTGNSVSWRRVRDSNPRCISAHSISSAAPSTTRTTLRTVKFVPAAVSFPTAWLFYQISRGLSTGIRAAAESPSSPCGQLTLAGATHPFFQESGNQKQCHWTSVFRCEEESHLPAFCRLCISGGAARGSIFQRHRPCRE